MSSGRRRCTGIRCGRRLAHHRDPSSAPRHSHAAIGVGRLTGSLVRTYCWPSAVISESCSRVAGSVHRPSRRAVLAEADFTGAWHILPGQDLSGPPPRGWECVRRRADHFRTICRQDGRTRDEGRSCSVARRVVVVDDLDGAVGAQTVTFSIDETTYTIDLAEHNLARLRDLLAPFIAASRRASARQGKRPDRALNREVRTWAAEEGIELNPLGRIPNSVLERFRGLRAPSFLRSRSRCRPSPAPMSHTPVTQFRANDDAGRKCSGRAVGQWAPRSTARGNRSASGYTSAVPGGCRAYASSCKAIAMGAVGPSTAR